MIKYSVMSKSGKMAINYQGYEAAKELFNHMKELWEEPYKLAGQRVMYFFEYGKIKKSGSLTDEQFLVDCEPKECWRMWYEGNVSCIVDDLSTILEEEREAKESGDADKFHYEKIFMSIFERDLLPEFEGF